MMRRSVIALARFVRLPIRRKLLYTEACARLIGAWVLVRGVPFKYWRAQLKQGRRVRALEQLNDSDLAFLSEVQHVFRQIKWASRDRATCLMMVLVARWVLNRRRLPGIIYLGVRRDEAKRGLHAHAWMQSALGVVGHEDIGAFTVVESFSV